MKQEKCPTCEYFARKRALKEQMTPEERDTILKNKRLIECLKDELRHLQRQTAAFKSRAVD